MIRKKTFEQARESYRMALLEYHAGRRSNTDLLDILNVLLENRLMLDQAILDYNSAGAWLKAVMGIL
ncbi:MAG: TolC family protein [Candidatus Marinimicrobia bacterium]|nr:TolC family protein [Candidatus Neomarinimicrobiota bacterium]MDZ7822555.1 TolC family protein [Candidatus Neomarinimicrobiota bacterium]